MALDPTPQDLRKLRAFFERGPGPGFWQGGYEAVHGYFLALASHPLDIPMVDILTRLFGYTEPMTGPDGSPSVPLPIDVQQAGYRDKDVMKLFKVLYKLFERIEDRFMQGQAPMPKSCTVTPDDPEECFAPRGALGRWAQGFTTGLQAFGHLAAFFDEEFPPGTEERAKIEEWLDDAQHREACLTWFADRDYAVKAFKQEAHNLQSSKIVGEGPEAWQQTNAAFLQTFPALLGALTADARRLLDMLGDPDRD
ncbi:hypothetical protein CCR81_03185 [Halorhodospira halophila]|nr:hypothetical protein [Halorhodospira halophila]